MSEHTKEPWHTGADNKLDLIIYDKDGWAISNAITYHGHHLVDEAKSNAKRIVACVNACEGFETDELMKFGALAILVRNRKYDLLKQHEEAFTALKRLVEIIDEAKLINLSLGVQLGQTSWYFKANECMEIARLAIKKYEANHE